MEEIYGLYVNNDAQMFIISPSDQRNGVIITTHEDTTEYASCNDGQLCIQDDQGMYDGTSVIRWNNGKLWRRMEISYKQYRVLTYRPYIPVTVLAFSVLKRFVTNCYRRLLG